MAENSDRPITAARIRIVTSDGERVPNQQPATKPGRRVSKTDLYMHIKLSQFCRAAGLPGKAYAVYSVILFETRTQKKSTIELGNGLFRESGIGANAKSRGLQALEQAGLIAVEYPPGCNPQVTLLK